MNEYNIIGKIIFRSMSPRGSPCYNCQEHGHISANCPKPWRHFRCINCTKTHVHAESCTSKWFKLQANFTQCENAEESRIFNRMEYQRQQLAVAIEEMREKRPLTVHDTAHRLERVVSVDEWAEMSLGTKVTRKAIEPAGGSSSKNEANKGAIPKTKRARADEAEAETNDRFAQQIADWPHNQPEPDPTQPPMPFDASVIDNFLQHAARFVLRRNLAADETDVAELMQQRSTWMYGRNKDPPSKVELAVHSVKGWQMTKELDAICHKAPQLLYDSNAPNPGNYKIHVSFEGRRRTVASAAGGTSVRALQPPIETATIDEVIEVPTIGPSFEWVFRFSHPEADTIALADAEGDVNAITEVRRELSNGLNIQRDGGMVEIRGPPTANVTVAMEYRDHMFRLRLCSTYVIVDERFRLDNTGVSRIIKNEEALSLMPEWEVGFLGAEFHPMRLRFADQRARLSIRDDELILVTA